MTTVSFATVDGRTHGTTSVPTGSPDEDTFALKTYLQTTFGWRRDDIVLELYEPSKYVILFDTASTRFIRDECSVVVVVGDATTEADKQTVQKELRAYIKRDQLRELDLNDIYSYYNITTIVTTAFYSCNLLTAIAIPSCITTIGSHAFCYCKSLATIAIPDSVTTIGVDAFKGCASLTTVAIPDSVTTIGSYAFFSCTSLTTIAIPDSVSTIGEHAFDDCTSLT